MPYKKLLQECLVTTIKTENKDKVRKEIIYKSASGDRTYIDEAPTMRSLASTDGHQAGSGAVKVREYDGELYIERPMTAAEYENVMGWEPGCTAKGITADGKEIDISETQRKKILGNGIIPAEITELLEGLKPILDEIL